MGIKAGYIGSLEALHVLLTDDDVLDNLVQRGTHVDIAVGIRRAIVQDELRFALVVLHELVVQVVVVPILEHDRFLLGQAGAHLKQGLGQVQSTVVLRLILSHWFYTLLYWFCNRKQRSYALILSKQLYGTQMMPCCRCFGNYSLKFTP